MGRHTSFGATWAACANMAQQNSWRSPYSQLKRTGSLLVLALRTAQQEEGRGGGAQVKRLACLAEDATRSRRRARSHTLPACLCLSAAGTAQP